MVDKVPMPVYCIIDNGNKMPDEARTARIHRFFEVMQNNPGILLAVLTNDESTWNLRKSASQLKPGTPPTEREEALLAAASFFTNHDQEYVQLNPGIELIAIENTKRWPPSEVPPDPDVRKMASVANQYVSYLIHQTTLTYTTPEPVDLNQTGPGDYSPPSAQILQFPGNANLDK